MKKQVKKWLTLIMAFTLILGSVRYNPLSASATEVSDPEIVDTASGGDSGESDTMEEGSVSGDMDTVSGDIVPGPMKAQMFGMARATTPLATGTYGFVEDSSSEVGFKVTGGSGNTHQIANGQLEIAYSGSGYPRVALSFPEGTELNRLKKISLSIADGKAGNVFWELTDDGSGKGLPSYELSGGTLEIWRTGALPDSASLEIKYSANGGNAGSGDTIKIENISLEFYDETYCNKTYTLAQHVRNANSNAAYDVATNVLSFSAKNTEEKFDLPEYVKNNVSQLRNVHFNVESLNFSPTDSGATAGSNENVAYKVYKDDISKWQNAIAGTKYSASTGNIDHTVAESDSNAVVGFGICDNYSTTAGNLTLKVKDVTYTFVDDGNLVEDVTPTGTYTVTVYASKLSKSWASAKSAELGSDNRFKVIFDENGTTNNGGEACLNLPTSINLGECESVTFNVKGQTGPINFCVGLSGTKQGSWYKNSENAAYILDPTELMNNSNNAKVNYTGSINQIHVQLYDWEGTKEGEIALESVVFTMKKTADDQADQEFGADKKPVDESTGNTTPAGDGVDDISLPATAANMTFIPSNAGTTVTSNSGVQAGEPNAQGSRQLHMDANYKSCIFELAEGIDLSQCTKATFAIPSLTNSMIIRLYTQEDIDNRGSKNWWDCYTAVEWSVNKNLQEISLSGKEGTLKYISISSGETTDADCTFDGVLFEMEAQEEPGETYTITVNASALDTNEANGAWIQNVTSAECTDDKRLKVVFSSANYSQTRIMLPDMSDILEGGKISLADCVDVTFNVKEQDGPVNFKAWLGTTACGTWNYNTGKTAYTRKPSEMVKDDQSAANYSGKIDAIGIQISGDTGNGDSIVLDSIVFTMKKTADQNDKVYGEPPTDEPVDLTENITPATTSEFDKRYTVKTGGLVAQSSSNVTCTPQEVEKVALTFSPETRTEADGEHYNYPEIKFDLPEPIDLAYAQTVTFAISDQKVPLSFKVYGTAENSTEVKELKVEYGKTAKTTTMDITGMTGKITSVAIMLNKQDVGTTNTCLFDGVLFKMNDPDMKTHEIVYNCSDLEVFKSENNATCTEADGKYTLSFPALNAGVSFKIPKIINMANCVDIQFTVSGQTGMVNYYLELDGSSKDNKYNFDVGQEHKWAAFTWTGGADGIKIQCAGQEYVPNSGITLEKITFTMKGEDGTNDFLNPEEADPEPTPVPADKENITPVKAESKRILAGVLKIAHANVTEYNKTTNDQIQITFNGAWSELKLKLPEAVNMLQCKGVTFAVSEQTVPLSFKLYKDGDLDNPVSAWYHEQNGNGIYTYEVSSAETVTHIGIMLHSNDVAQARAAAANYCVFDGVVFDMDTTISTETHTVTVPANELKLKTSEAASCNLENGNWMIKFSNMDQKVNFTLPEIVNLEKCVNIVVTVATQNGPMNFYVGMDSVQQGSVYNYNTGKTEYVLEPNAASKINEFGIQCGRENNGTTYVPDSVLELVSVSFLMRGPEPEETPADNVYSAGKLYTTSKDADVTQATDANGVTTITFPRKDNSITYEVPDAIATNHMTSIQFLPSLSGVKVELLNAKGKVLMEGTEGVLATNCNPEVKYIRLVSLADNTELTLNGIKFNVDPNAFESIVLNGRFEREDLSMWNGIGTWGNATITAKTSDTEIIEGSGVYSYAEITGRESPYHSFAQDVSDRTTHQTGYIFSFWAKLSDDYKGAAPELRTVEFSPYFLDGAGNPNYNMYRTGAYKQVLDPGVWTHFSGIVNLPSGATGFIIRIVEQGTNYGQGTCLLGSYAITDVSLTPTSLATEPNYRWSGGGSRSNTITKEATCEVAYELKDLSIDWASAKAAAQKTGMQAEFTNNYDEVRLKLPRTLDMSTCAYIRLNVPAQNVPIALKLYRKGKQVDVAYYNDIAGSYLMVPEYDGMIDAIGIMSLSTPNPAGAFALADLITFGLTQEPAPEEVSNSIVINGDFADEDMSDWSAALWGNGVTITQQTASKPIFGDTYTYATYSRRTSPYQCFAQDITGRVQQNETYTFSFWAKLSNDYKGAPENQRVVQFAPYTVDKNGKEDYNPRLDGVYSQVLEPGVWTYFEGTYKVTNDNPISKVVIRILEQGTKYGQGDCVMGSYSVAGVRMARYIPEPPSIDEDVPNLKDAMAEVFGDDFIMGTAVTVNEMEDLGIEMLVNKHFNAVTIGNELKPDALFNYSNDEHTPLQTITFNGQKLEVPTLYFGRAEEILDTLKKWNESHPDQEPIKVRGHVLVWHSQTPEWFFREGYTVKQNADGSENYVTPEVMNQRLEWYIKTVLEHFTGEDSPYKDMFYGWDVVNEAVSNGGNGYRTEKASAVEPLSQSTHSTNSSWWAVYQSNEFILNAFRFANQYAPADVELYYNDYNECDNKKVAGIVKLLKDVKEAEGTRIDGMGMQGHYNMFNPYMSDIERAIRAYSEVVDKVMYTEFDMKVSGDISQDEAREKEYMAQAERYHDIYVLLKNLNAEEGINIAGFTVWGTVDKYSWLQNSSDVGGGADGTLTQCPLLFDYDYKVKPSYWAFVDYTMVDPDWTEEKAADEAEEPKPEEQETPEVEDTPETQPEAEPVVEPSPVIEEQKKNNPALVIGLAVGAVVLGAGAGVGFYFFKKKKKVTK